MKKEKVVLFYLFFMIFFKFILFLLIFLIFSKICLLKTIAKTIAH